MHSTIGYLIAGAAGLLLLISRVLRIAFIRFLIGHHIIGRTTNYALIHRADVVIHVSGRSTRWGRASMVERAAVRLIVVAAAAGGTYGYFVYPVETMWTAVAVGAAILTWTAWAVRRAVRRSRHYRTYVLPLHRTLSPILGMSVSIRPDSWLSIPQDFATNEDAVIQIKLPKEYVDSRDSRASVVNIVSSKLGLVDPDVKFHMIGHPVATFKIAPRPPDRVNFADVLDVVGKASETAPVIGIGQRNTIISSDLDADAPHVLISASSGAGKSVMSRLIVAQGLHNGAVALVLDVKRISHAWARGLPNVRYCRHIADIHNALIEAAQWVTDRYDIIDDAVERGENIDSIDVGPRIFILAEEMNATADQLRAYWRKVREKGEPNVSPAIEALGSILFMGRAAKVHVVAIAQYLTANTVGGGAARENFAVRILARYTWNAWKLLVPEVSPMPRSSKRAGRVQVVAEGVARETQVIYAQPDDARAWATSGTVTPFEAAAAAGSVSAPDLGSEAVTVTGSPARLHVVRDVDSDSHLVGLSEACSNGTLSVSLTVVRAARARDVEFPASRGQRGAEKLYSVEELQQWERNRPRAKSS